MESVFQKFKGDLDNRDVTIIRHLFQYQEENGKGIGFNKFEELINSNYSEAKVMARQTLAKHIKKLIEMGLLNKKLDKKSKLKKTPVILTLSDISWKSLKEFNASKLMDLIDWLEMLKLEEYDVILYSERIIDLLILSLGRLFKQCIETTDPHLRTIFFNVTYDLIKQIFEKAILKCMEDSTTKSKMLDVLESAFKPYNEKYEKILNIH